MEPMEYSLTEILNRDFGHRGSLELSVSQPAWNHKKFTESKGASDWDQFCFWQT